MPQPKPKPVKLTETELSDLAAEFAAEIDLQRQEQKQTYDDFLRWTKIYRAKPPTGAKDYPLEQSSNVIVAIAAIYAEQMIARILQAIFGPQPHWVATQLNKKFAEHVKPFERYMEWCRKNMWDQAEVVKYLVQDAVKLGTGVIYNDYKVETLYRYDDALRQTVPTGTRRSPSPVWVARDDFLLPIGFSDPQTSPWVSHRMWFSWDLLQRLQHQNFIENLDDLKGNSDDESDMREARRRNGEAAHLSGQDDRFGLWAPEYVWFRRDLDQDGWPEEYVMLLHLQTQTILRLIANPSPTGLRPYTTARFIGIEGEFDGMGIPEMVECLQAEASTIHNQRRDRAHLANIVMYKGRTGGSVPDSIRPRSGKVIKLVDPNDLVEFHPSSNVQIDAYEENIVLQLAALRVGLNDLDTNRMTSPMGRAAASTVMAMMQEGARRFDLSVADIRRGLSGQAHQIVELWQTYGLSPAEEAGSPEEVLDEKEAALVRELIERPASLRGLVSIQLNAATAAVNREVEKQANIQLYGIVQQYMQQLLQLAPVIAGPQVPQEIKALVLHAVQGMDKLLAKIFQSHDAFDLEGVLAGELFERMMMQSQMAAQQRMMGQPGQPGQMMQPQQPQIEGLPTGGNGEAEPMM